MGTVHDLMGAVHEVMSAVHGAHYIVHGAHYIVHMITVSNATNISRTANLLRCETPLQSLLLVKEIKIS